MARAESLKRQALVAASIGMLQLSAPQVWAQDQDHVSEELAQSQTGGAIALKPRLVPPPELASPEARESVKRNALAVRRRTAAPVARPAVRDKAAWTRIIAATDSAYAPTISAIKAQAEATVERVIIGGVTVYRGIPERPRADRADRIVLHVHGGGFAMLAKGNYAAAMAADTASRCGCRTFSVNYRAPPDFPYPTPVDDVLSVYKELLRSTSPQNIAIQGESAGGNIAAAVVLKARDQNLPMPAMVILGSAGLDLTRSGDSHTVNEGLDLALSGGIASLIELYADGHDLKSPYLSPVFGDFAKGFPPTFLKVGGREILLSDSIAMHRALRRAGVEAQLHIWEGMSHGPFGSPANPAPEDMEARVEIERFLEAHWR